jgi:hypothetical protein
MRFSYRLRQLLIRLGFLTINRNYAAGLATAVNKGLWSPLNKSNRDKFPLF